MFLAASPSLAASQLFTDIQTGHHFIAIPILAPNVRFFSTKDIRPALKLQPQASLEGGQGGGKSPTKNGGGGKAADGSGKQASGGDNGSGDDKLVSSLKILLTDVQILVFTISM